MSTGGTQRNHGFDPDDTPSNDGVSRSRSVPTLRSSGSAGDRTLNRVRFVGFAAATSVTTGRDVARAGLAALLFGAVGFLWVHFGLPQMSKTFGFGDWYKKRGAKVWNYGIVALVAVGGTIALLVGLVAWATGTTFS